MNAFRHSPRSLLLRLFRIRWLLGGLLLPASWSAVGTAVFLDQLHGGVVLCRILELLDRLAALFLLRLELGLKAFDTEVVVARDDDARCIDAV